MKKNGKEVTKMKRRWMMVCGLLLVVVLLCACGRQESPVEDFEYTIVDGEVIITGYTGSEREIVIPAKIADREVTKIGEYAFEGYDMVKVEFPDSLREIGEGAFYRCKCLIAVSIPESVEVIGDGAFYSCVELSELKLPDAIESIGECAFGNCAKLDEDDVDENAVRVIIRQYLSSGDLESEKDVLYTYKFDLEGRCISSVAVYGDGNEYVTTYTYDSEGKLASSVSGSDGNEIVYTYTYDEQGNLSSYVQNYAGVEHIISYSYDDDGRILCITIDGDNKLKNEYIYNKWKLERINSFGSYQTAEFDWRGRVIRSISYNQGATASYATTEYTYDELGRTIKMTRTDAEGAKYEEEYFYN